MTEIMVEGLFERVAPIIDFVKQDPAMQVDLDVLSDALGKDKKEITQFFKEWSGVDIHRFFQLVREKRRENLETNEQPSLFDISSPKGKDSHLRLQADFIKILPMEEAEYAGGYQNLEINYDFHETPFGKAIMGTTEKGICFMAFQEEEGKGLFSLKEKYPKARFRHTSDERQLEALRVFEEDWESLPEIDLHLKATDFQLLVWNQLLKISLGELRTYQKLADEIGRPSAPRATGTTIGSNSVAYLIPCHRVIQSTGGIGNFKWGGSTRKIALIGWEAVKAQQQA